MSTIRQQLRDLVIDALNADRPIDIPEFTKRRWYPTERDDDLSCAVIFVQEPSQPVGGRGGVLQDRFLHIGVQVVGGHTQKDFLDDMLEPALEWVTSVLGGAVLGVLSTDVSEVETQWEQAKMDKYFLAATVVFKIRYQTKRNDLASAQ